MDKYYNLGLYDYDKQKICDLYDSQTELAGQAYNIRVTTEISGYHTLEFSIPYIVNEVNINENIYGRYGTAIFGISKYGGKDSGYSLRNFRWDILRSDFLIRYTDGEKNIWFVANKPKKSKSGKKINGDVTCSGYESLLKTRNIYMSFDDDNGIGTIAYLIGQVLKGTGWTFDTVHSDIIYENDGETEKIRSLKSDGKKGALDLISTICNLFQARPIFDTDNQVITVKAMKNREQVLEGEVGKNLSALTVNFDSSNICTRVYVEGEYGDYGYVGIDDVVVDGERWGLPFIVNFDYYREIGAFKQSHETALANYLHDIREKKAEISANGALLIACEDEINNLIGQCKLAVYYKSGGSMELAYTWGDLTNEQKVLNVGDDIVILYNDRTIGYDTWTGVSQVANAYGVAKFVTSSAGKIGAAEVQVEAKEKEIDELKRKINVTVKEDVKDEYRAEIARLQDEIDAVYSGYPFYNNKNAYAVGDNCTYNTSAHGDSHNYRTALAYECITAIPQPETTHEWNANEWNQVAFSGLFKMMHDITNSNGLLKKYNYYVAENIRLNEEQDDIEATFIVAMGYMLRDGYWSNQNYINGQEEFLYNDAVDMAKEMSKPATTYSFSYVRVTEEFSIPDDEIDVNAIFRIYDKELKVDHNMFIKKVTYGVDNKSIGSIEVSDQDITLTNNDLSSLLSRMSQLADLIEQKNALYERAKALTSTGNLYTDRLNGQIDVLKTQLMSTVSNWFTDDNGNIMFLSADGGSAMMLSGAGFMIADRKDNNGNWDWRTFGSGHGFTADEIVAGFISADRIEAGTISTSKVTSDFGQSLMISSSQYISLSATNFDELGDVSSGIYLSPTAVKINSGGTFELHSTNLDIATDGTVTARSIALNGGSINIKNGYGRTVFSVSNEGYLTSKVGSIGNWIITEDYIGNNSGINNCTIGMKVPIDPDNNEIVFWSGGRWGIDHTGFRVYEDGTTWIRNHYVGQGFNEWSINLTDCIFITAINTTQKKITLSNGAEITYVDNV